MIKFLEKRIPVSVPEQKAIKTELARPGLVSISNLTRLVAVKVVFPNQFFPVGTTVYVYADLAKADHKILTHPNGVDAEGKDLDCKFILLDHSQILAVEEPAGQAYLTDKTGAVSDIVVFPSTNTTKP